MGTNVSEEPAASVFRG